MSQLGSYRFHELGAAGRGVLVASEHAPCGDQDLTLCASVAERVRFWDRPFGPGRACQLHSASFRVHPTPPDASRDRDDRHP
jgi:hypothetical protein